MLSRATSLTSAEEGKATSVGCCFSSATFPLRQPRRISNSKCVQPVARVATTSPVLDHRGGATLLRRRRAPFTLGHLLPAEEPRGSACHPTGGRCRISLHLGSQSCNDPAQHIAKSLGSVAPSIIGFLHERNHEGSHDREAVNCCRDLGNVCRDSA